LPAIETFVATLESMGLRRDDHVVVYDQTQGSTAARLWWMLRHVGHERVAVLDGGWSAWLEADGPQTAGIPEAEPSIYSAEVRTDDVASRDEVANRTDSVTLIDARAPARYRGEVEPIDPVAGHIPGAINIPYEALAPEGTMLPPHELADRLEAASESIAYCGSGVTACYVILAFAVAGLPLPRLYVGSWSDWVDANMPVDP
jgi:thiosulfate/3-mercaptopyruvate sulfurtransferase